MTVRSQISFFAAFSKVLTFRRITNFLLVESGFLLSRIFRKVIVAGKPWAASIEPTTSCNLRCIECPTGMQSLVRSKGNMSTGVFKEILDKLSPDLIYLTLYFQGEPMLNPHFSEMIFLARSRNIFVSTSTNGHFLNERNVNLIIKSGLNHLIISMDGLDQETYEKYRVKGNLQTVKAGIERLVAAKKILKSKSPLIEIQFLILRHNEHQLEQMKVFARNAGVDKLSFKSAQVYNFRDENSIIPTIKEKSRYRQLPDGSWVIAKKFRNRCPRIWSSLVVTWDGKTVPCCYDKDADYQTGNLVTDPLMQIWKNHAYSEFRNRVLSDRADIDICRNCGE